MIDQIISHFRILEKLGEGGMGIVYKAQDTMLERPVAIKFLPREIAAEEEAKQRFIIEAKAAAVLNHPNIATIHQIGDVDNIMFIVMEYVEGQNLRQLLRAQPDISVKDARIYALQIAEGLLAAHKKSVVHRDIKSANIMLTGDGHIKIMDFGLAKLAGQISVTKSGAAVGTIAYMSPEQAGGEVVDHRTDIWSYGVLLYEMLTGNLPFQGDYEMAIMYAIMNKDPKPPEEMRSDIPPWLSIITQKAMQKDPKDRYQSMLEVITALEKTENDFEGTTSHSPESASRPTKRIEKMPKSHISSKGERRQVAIVASNLTGYESLIENLDLEEVDEVLETIGNQVTEIVNKHDGLVNKLTEDEIVLLFGVPITYEDDLNRAVRSAIELHKLIARVNQDLSDKFEAKLQVHSGIDAGLMIVQPIAGMSRQYKLTGEPKQIALKLAAEAGNDEILMSSISRRLVKPFFDTEACDSSFTVRGRSQPVKPFVVKGESGVHTRFEIDESVELSALQGRETELALLNSALQNALAGDGQFLTISGEAGLGKSRLLYEFRKQLDPDVKIIQGSCQSFGSTIPYFPFRGLIRELLDIAAKDPDGENVETIVSRILAIDSSLKPYIALFLQLFSIESEEYPLPEQLQGEDFQYAFAEVISAILTFAAKQKAMIVLLEDWHWVDDASQNVLRQLAELVSSFPLSVIVTYRPEVNFEWGHPANHTQIRLAPLEASFSAGIAKTILGAESLPQDLADLIHERTGGNPFFVEELCQTLQEGGAIKVVDKKVSFNDPENKIDLPHTIQSVIRSRLDRLDSDSLEAIRVASVVGREFTQNLLSIALSNDINLQQSLKTLRTLGLIRQSQVLPEAAFRFKHALTQEVTYDSMLKHQRKSIHGLIGEILTKVYEDRLEEHATILMDHFAHADDWEKAVHFGRKAIGDLTVLPFSAALTILGKIEQWIHKLPRDEEHRAILIDILLKTERSCENLGYRKRQRETIDRLLALTESNDINRAEVNIRLGDLCILTNQFEEAENALQEALRLCKELAEEDTEVRVLRSLGYLKLQQGNATEAVAITRKVIEISKRNGMAEALVQDLSSLFSLLARLGDLDGAKKCVDEALELYDQVSPRISIYIYFMAGNYYRYTGDYAKAIEYLTAMADIFEGLDLGGKPTTAFLPLAYAYLAEGKIEDALECYERAIKVSRSRKIASELAIALFEMGRTLTNLGRDVEALARFEEAAKVFRQLQNHEYEAETWCAIATATEKVCGFQAAFSTWEKIREMGQNAEDLKLTLTAVKGMARSSRALAEKQPQTLELYKVACNLAEKMEDSNQMGELHNTMGIIEWQSGHYEQALVHYEKAYPIFLEQKDLKHAGFILNSIANTLIKQGKFEEALLRLKKAIQLHKDSKQLLLEGHALAMQGDIFLISKQLNKAKKAYENSLQIRQKINDRKGEGWMTLQLAKVLAAEGQPKKSEEYLTKAKSICQECGDQKLQAELQMQ